MRYHEGELEMQRRAGASALAERVARIISSEIPAAAAAFLAERTFVVVASVDSRGAPTASLLGGPPGFASAIDPRSIAIAAAFGPIDRVFADVEASGIVGMLAIDFDTRRRFRANGTARRRGASLLVTTDEVYSNCPQYIHPQVVSAIGGSEIREGRVLTADQQEWIRRADTFFLATAHRGADASHRGGEPGFIDVAPSRLTWPDYRGNNMFNSLGNLLRESRCGLLFVDFTRGATLQLRGTATVRGDEERVITFEVAEIRETR